MKRLLVAVLAVVLLSGCGGSKDQARDEDAGNALGLLTQDAPVAEEVAGVQGFLASGSTSVDYLQWQGTSGAVTGTLSHNALDGVAPQQAVKSSTLPVTLSLADKTVTLVINGTTVYGTLDGDALTLNFPQNDGSIQASSWTRASPDAYNTALAALRGDVGSGNAQQAAADNEAALATAVGEAANKVNAATEDVARSTEGLAASLSGLDRDTAETVKAADAVVRSARRGDDAGSVCADAGGVAAGAGGVEADAGGVEADASSIKYAVDSARAASVKLVDALQAAQAVVPDYNGSAKTPSPADVTSLRQALDAAVTRAINEANAAIDHANAQARAAFQAAVRADKAGNCDSPPDAPTAVQHIS